LKEKASPPFNNSFISNSCLEEISREKAKVCFIHDLDCKGILFLGQDNFTKIIVCSLCRLVSSYDNFSWYCPICKRKDCKKNSLEYNKKENLFEKLDSTMSTNPNPNINTNTNTNSYTRNSADNNSASFDNNVESRKINFTASAYQKDVFQILRILKSWSLRISKISRLLFETLM